LTFWKIFLAHVLTDFVFQSDSIAENKGEGKILSIHCLTFFLLSTLLLLPTLSFKVTLVIAALSLFHGAVDYPKHLIEQRAKKDSWLYFVVDQSVHILGIGIAFLILERGYYQRFGHVIAEYWTNPVIFLIISFFVAIVFGGSFLTGLLCRSFLDTSRLKRKPGIEKAGRYLGILERSLVLTAVLMGKFEFIGFLIAAKSIARYPEIRGGNRFAEYYLIGTLTSISIALFGGLFLRYLIGW
jgi:hypothetical protein